VVCLRTGRGRLVEYAKRIPDSERDCGARCQRNRASLEGRRKRAVGPNRLEAAKTSIGLTQGLAAAKIELRALLEQYEMFAKQLEGIMTEVAVISSNPGNQGDADYPRRCDCNVSRLLR
jgi:hypothetical protein